MAKRLELNREPNQTLKDAGATGMSPFVSCNY